MAFVVDASMALAWHFADEAHGFADGVLERTLAEPIVVPRHWWLEVANGALMGERRGRSLPAQTARFEARLAMIDVETDEEGGGDIFARILPLARAHRLTVYDAVYLELAERRGLALATLDRDLGDAARAIGVEVLEQQ
ncbi:type II toxin-antitoxin system VapC family toxin [Sphingomonas naphthae]|uniref:Ribonuclease VapC n=1 Tax=Sphingomonas naphthae TaxID=1813468 RepID=A0ABY7TNH5_9SPHN|nr:type II toxin-antitoxin system VapC family toxin [Sphingomonas naphthae]WCT74782.1 type II toxin-antitoxin system VapC family toxin [Sphingomonas naphthae]